MLCFYFVHLLVCLYAFLLYIDQNQYSRCEIFACVHNSFFLIRNLIGKYRVKWVIFQNKEMSLKSTKPQDNKTQGVSSNNILRVFWCVKVDNGQDFGRFESQVKV